MAKSSSKQCRKRKAPRQAGGGLVVVNQVNLSRARQAAPAPPTKRKVKGKGKKKKGKLSMDEVMASSDGSESGVFNNPPPPPPPPPGPASDHIPKYSFSSTLPRGQRLYYLLSTRPPAVHQHQQFREGGNTATAPSDASASVVVAAAAGAAITAEGGCHALVFVEATAVAQELVGELKALNLVAFALHDRTPKSQAREHVKRFLSAPSAQRSSVLILTNSALARAPTSFGPVKPEQGPFLRVIHFDAPEGSKNAAARERVAGVFSRGREAGAAEEVHLEGGGDAASLAPFAFDSSAMGGIRSRLAVAKKLARAVAMSADEGEERGMQRAAAAADLEWDGGAGQSESGADTVKHETKRAHAQQAAALRQRVSVLLCQPLLPPPPPPTVAGATARVVTAASRNAQPQSAKELRKKMAVLGMIHGPQAAGAGGGSPPTAAAGGATAAAGRGGDVPEDRAAARTRWLDGEGGEAFGNSWAGSVRTGASCDSASREVRDRVEAAKRAGKAAGGGGGGGGGGGRSTSGKEGGATDAMAAALAEWNPNPDTPNPEQWGGRWGKPCGHNEIVLQHLRPFAPMEVVNTRVCSRASPAPGNTGFDGCLELLSLTCRAHERALTVWDEASFIHIDSTGECSTLPKQAMLHLPLPALRFLMKNMRAFTVCGGGQEPPREVARAVIRAVGWGAKQSKFGPLSAELSRRVMSFVVSGDLATWTSISAKLGLTGGRQPGAAASGDASPRDTLAFASKKKRKNFNL